MISGKYKDRIIDNTVIQYLDIFGAIVIEGPKWYRKTWATIKASNSQLFL